MALAIQLLLLILFIGIVPSISLDEDNDDLPLTPGTEALKSKHAAPVSDLDMDTEVSSSTRRVLYKGPFPKFLGRSGDSPPLVALHSPIRMYIPIRYRDVSSAESPGCVRCPRNLILYRKRQGPLLTPVPTLSICPGLARHPGRVHVAVVSGPRPGQRLSIGQHQIELVVWKAKGPVHSCQYTITVRGRKIAKDSTKPLKKKLTSCSSIISPHGVAVACDPPERRGRRLLPQGSVCQFFCLPNFVGNTNERGSTTTICENGRWSPKIKLSCEAATCPTPVPQSHGAWDCTSVNPHSVRSDWCRLRCFSGYVVPTTQLKVATIFCDPPQWNDSSVAQCERAHLPILKHCHDRFVIISEGLRSTLSPNLLPVGINKEGKSITPSCSLQGDFPAGDHKNYCKVTDPELRLQSNCSYIIHVKERSPPKPHPDDCRNQTVKANRRGIYTPKPVRFLVTAIGVTSRTEILLGECNPGDGDFGIGQHLVSCKTTDSKTNITGTCSFWLNIRAKRPSLIAGCQNLTVTSSLPLNVTVPQPTFQTPWTNDTVPSTCSPPFLTAQGSVHITCSTEKGDSTCSFEMTVLQEEEELTTEEKSLCELPDPPLHGSLQCVDGGERCQVICNPGYGLFGRIDPLFIQCEDGLWDFQKLNDQMSLLDCLAQTEGTAVEVWMGFHALAPHCDEDLEDHIRKQVEVLCPLDTRCIQVYVNCTLDEESDVVIVAVNWTVQADFEPEEENDSEDIPEAETRLEAALEEGRAFVNSKEEPESLPGLRLLQDSFRRGLITLVCPDHFIPDMMAAMCVDGASS